MLAASAAGFVIVLSMSWTLLLLVARPNRAIFLPANYSTPRLDLIQPWVLSATEKDRLSRSRAYSATTSATGSSRYIDAYQKALTVVMPL